MSKYRNAPALGETLGRILALGREGKHDEAQAVATTVEVESQKAKAFGRSALVDTVYAPRSAAGRAKFQGKAPAQVAASAVSHYHDNDYGPPTSDKHKLVMWFEKHITSASSPAVAAEKCAAAVLDKNARRISIQRRDVVLAVNELLIRFEELGGGHMDLVQMLSLYESPLVADTADDADVPSIATDAVRDTMADGDVSTPDVTTPEVSQTDRTDTDEADTADEPAKHDGLNVQRLLADSEDEDSAN